MIEGILIINNKGKIRFEKIYSDSLFEGSGSCVDQVASEVFRKTSEKQKLEGSSGCNFVNGVSGLNAESRVVFRQYATLLFVCIVDSEESELGVLDLIQVLVESLDAQFKNVCEVDLAFNPHKLAYVLDELITDGLVCETNIATVTHLVNAADHQL